MFGDIWIADNDDLDENPKTIGRADLKTGPLKDGGGKITHMHRPSAVALGSQPKSLLFFESARSQDPKKEMSGSTNAWIERRKEYNPEKDN